MPGRARPTDRGPFRADQLRSGDPYELSDGHAIYCAPAGGSGSEPNRLGASVVGWDPAVTEAGIDTGYAPSPGTLRAPDVAVGNVPNKPGWVAGAPELAIEYADIGQDEQKLKEKIRDLLDAGTRYLWVVRLAGPRRVEVHQSGNKVRTVLPGGSLTAPGVLQNAVPVEALYDRDAAERATFTNLLGVLEARGLRVGKGARERIAACSDLAQLDRWIRRAAIVDHASELFEEAAG